MINVTLLISDYCVCKSTTWGMKSVIQNSKDEIKARN